jgi:ferrochelatase
MSRRRIAVVLANLGGPDGPDSVEPFLFNLFNDPAIIGLPGLIRTPLAKLISSRRRASAQANYDLMGGGSPLLPETEKQAEALLEQLRLSNPGDEHRVFIAMRYWGPMTEQTAREVEAYGPDHVVFLPLYPQFSTTTTASSLKAWRKAYRGSGQLHVACCWPDAAGWIEAQADLISSRLAEAGDAPVRVLFSAHGIPEKLVTAGDPYQSQVEATVAAVVDRLGLVDWQICYQSRVGPLKWLGPSTPEAIRMAADDGLGVVIAPIAFVSEHIETLVELDIEYRHLADDLGCKPYLRAPAVGLHPSFISELAGVAIRALSTSGVSPQGAAGGSDCSGFRACPSGCARQGKRAA